MNEKEAKKIRELHKKTFFSKEHYDCGCSQVESMNEDCYKAEGYLEAKEQDRESIKKHIENWHDLFREWQKALAKIRKAEVLAEKVRALFRSSGFKFQCIHVKPFFPSEVDRECGVETCVLCDLRETSAQWEKDK